MENKYDINDFYEKIKNILHSKNCNGNDLKNILGLKKSPLTDWKNGVSKPTLQQIISILNYFDISFEDIFLKNPSENANAKFSHFQMYADLNLVNKERINGMIELKFYEQKLESSDKTHIEEHCSIYDNNSNLSLFELQEKKSDDIVEIPVLGKTAAGDFIYITDEGVYDLKIEQQDPRADYALEVDGDSMEPLIKNGTYIEVQETNYVDNGTIAIVKYNDQVTCKKFYNDGNGKIRLKSLNPNYQDIFLQLTEYDDENDSFCIIGRVLI